MTQSPASAAQAATHFRFIRAISVLHCYTQSCLCTVAANSPPPPPGWQLYMCHRCPGMSPTPRSAQYPVSHGCHHMPGWRITSPLVIIVALGHRLRRRRSGDRSAAPIDIYHATRRAEVRSAGGASHFRFIRLIRGVDCYTQCCALPGESSRRKIT